MSTYKEKIDMARAEVGDDTPIEAITVTTKKTSFASVKRGEIELLPDHVLTREMEETEDVMFCVWSKNHVYMNICDTNRKWLVVDGW